MQNFNGGYCCCKDLDLFAAATCGGKISLKLAPVDAEVHKAHCCSLPLQQLLH
jgi:hypothetical protein